MQSKTLTWVGPGHLCVMTLQLLSRCSTAGVGVTTILCGFNSVATCTFNAIEKNKDLKKIKKEKRKKGLHTDKRFK